MANLDLNVTPPSSPDAADFRQMANFDLNVTPPASPVAAAPAAAPDAAVPDAAAPDAAAPDAAVPDAAAVSAPPSARRRGRPPGTGKHQRAAAGGSGSAPSVPPSARPRGRPPGTGKHQRAAAGGSGASFGMEYIECTTGEDIVAMLNDISLKLDRDILVSQANGAVSAVTLLVPTPPRRTVTHKGPFRILSLSGKIGALIISFVGDDTAVVQSGFVSGGLIASSPVQVLLTTLPRDGNGNEPNAAGLEAHNVQGGTISGGLIANSPVQVTAATLPRGGNGNEPNAASTSQPSSSSLPLGLNLSIDGVLRGIGKEKQLD